MNHLTGKKILFVESSNEGTVGGSHYSLYYLIKAMAHYGLESTVILYEDINLSDKYKSVGANVLFHKPAKPRYFKFKNKVLRKYLNVFLFPYNFIKCSIIPIIKNIRFINRHKIDLVHLNNSALFSLDWVIATQLTGIACVSHMRGYHTYIPFLRRTISAMADKTVCVSASVKESLEASNFNNKNSIVIHNAIDVDDVRPDKSRSELLEEFSVGENDFIVGIVGNIKEWKGQLIVVEALNLLKEKVPDIKCLMVGVAKPKDPYYETLNDKIAGYGLKNNVVFTGFQNNVANSLSIMDVVLHASIEPEPFGRVIIEAMSMSKPVVAARAGGVPEIIEENVSGLLHSPANYNDLASKILQLFESSQLRETVGINARQRVLSEFNTAKHSERMAQIFQKLIT